MKRQGPKPTEETVLDRMAAWGLPRYVCEKGIAEVVRADPLQRGASRLNYLLRRHRGQR